MVDLTGLNKLPFNSNQYYGNQRKTKKRDRKMAQ